jgi:hypothetical protein
MRARLPRKILLCFLAGAVCLMLRRWKAHWRQSEFREAVSLVGVFDGLVFALWNLVLGGFEVAMATSLVWVPNCCFGVILGVGYRSFAGARRYKKDFSASL